MFSRLSTTVSQLGAVLSVVCYEAMFVCCAMPGADESHKVGRVRELYTYARINSHGLLFPHCSTTFLHLCGGDHCAPIQVARQQRARVAPSRIAQGESVDVRSVSLVTSYVCLCANRG